MKNKEFVEEIEKAIQKIYNPDGTKIFSSVTVGSAQGFELSEKIACLTSFEQKTDQAFLYIVNPEGIEEKDEPIAKLRIYGDNFDVTLVCPDVDKMDKDLRKICILISVKVKELKRKFL